MSISQICNISLKSNVFLHPMTTECSHGHEQVCSNIIQLNKIKINNSFLWVIFFSRLSCINEYLAIDSGGNVSE